MPVALKTIPGGTVLEIDPSIEGEYAVWEVLGVCCPSSSSPPDTAEATADLISPALYRPGHRERAHGLGGARQCLVVPRLLHQLSLQGRAFPHDHLGALQALNRCTRRE